MFSDWNIYMIIRKPYDEVPRIYGTIIDSREDKTQQKFENESNINTIMSKYNNNVDILNASLRIQGATRQPQYGDFTNIPDFMTANQMIIDANNAFSQLPAKLREKFANDPSKLISWLENPMNNDEAIKLGLKGDIAEFITANTDNNTEQTEPKKPEEKTQN